MRFSNWIWRNPVGKGVENISGLKSYLVYNPEADQKSCCVHSRVLLQHPFGLLLDFVASTARIFVFFSSRQMRLILEQLKQKMTGVGRQCNAYYVGQQSL